jgi:hypothetical protein
VSTHAEEMLADTGVDPSEVLLLRATEEETEVIVGSSVKSLQAAAKARLGLGKVVTGLTRPTRVNQLSFEWPSSGRR